MSKAEYKILNASDIEGMEELVEESMRQGFRPQGGICYVTGTEDHYDWFYQAMFRIINK